MSSQAFFSFKSQNTPLLQIRRHFFYEKEGEGDGIFSKENKSHSCCIDYISIIGTHIIIQGGPKVPLPYKKLNISLTVHANGLSFLPVIKACLLLISIGMDLKRTFAEQGSKRATKM